MRKFLRYLKKGIKNPKNFLIKNPIYFLYLYIKLNTLINRIDNYLPLKGDLAKYGFFESKITSNSCRVLKKYFMKYEKYNKNLNLKKDLIPVIDEIFNKINKPIREYLGEDAKLDGFSFMKTSNKDSKENYSANWHTDNVGVRIKMFICIEGDGLQPTKILSPSEIYNKRSIKILRNFFYEFIRWFGLNNQVNLSKSYNLNHKKGSLYLFDTNFLHRGSYENAKNTRIIFKAEFSCPEKHIYLKNENIGTNKNNQFSFVDKFYDLAVFKSYLDNSRITKNDKNNFYKK